jgi:hypothetical protein
MDALIRNMKYAMDQGLLLEDKIYTRESAEALFNAHGAERLEEGSLYNNISASSIDLVPITKTVRTTKDYAVLQFRLFGWHAGKEVVWGFEDLGYQTDDVPTLANVEKILGPLTEEIALHSEPPLGIPPTTIVREVKNAGWRACISVELQHRADPVPKPTDLVRNITITQWRNGKQRDYHDNVHTDQPRCLN